MELEKKKAEIRDLLRKSDKYNSKKRWKRAENFIDDLYSVKMETESWVSVKENVIPCI